MRFLKRTRGFSLIEILMVLALAFIFLQLIEPSWSQFFQRSRSEALLATLSQALEFARSEALLQQTTVSLCASEDQQSCSGQWQQGFVVFRDLEQNGYLSQPSQLLQAFHFSSLGAELHWRVFPQDRAYVQFLPSGNTNQENGSFWYCSKAAASPSWVLALSKSGRLRVLYPNRDGVIQDQKGSAFTCL